MYIVAINDDSSRQFRYINNIYPHSCVSILKRWYIYFFFFFRNLKFSKRKLLNSRVEFNAFSSHFFFSTRLFQMSAFSLKFVINCVYFCLIDKKKKKKKKFNIELSDTMLIEEEKKKKRKRKIIFERRVTSADDAISNRNWNKLTNIQRNIAHA